MQAIHAGFAYSRRETAGVQSPAETIRLGSGTCRDFAVLFMEAARHLGFAARFVTGYVYDPSADDDGVRQADGTAVRGGGATHAWADVFVRGAGWVEFDPTNRIIAGRNLIRIATTRNPAQALPLSGTFERGDASFLGMEVQVDVGASYLRSGPQISAWTLLPDLETATSLFHARLMDSFTPRISIVTTLPRTEADTRQR